MTEEEESRKGRLEFGENEVKLISVRPLATDTEMGPDDDYGDETNVAATDQSQQQCCN